MKTPTEKGMESLKENMVQMRHDAIEEIKEGVRNCIDDCVDHMNEKYHMFDKRTQQLVELQGRELMDTVNDSEWYQHEMLELLKQNEDDAFEQMTWIIEPESAPPECVPFDSFTADLPEMPVPTMCLPVGRSQYIQGIEELGKSSLAQDAILHKAFNYLQKTPKVVNHETAAQEAQSIAKVKHLIYTQWVREIKKAHHMYILLMKGRGGGINDRATGVLQESGTDMELD